MGLKIVGKIALPDAPVRPKLKCNHCDKVDRWLIDCGKHGFLCDNCLLELDNNMNQGKGVITDWDDEEDNF